MSTIQAAKFVGMTERGDRKYVDAEVWLAGREEPLLAAFVWNDGQPELAHVYKKDVSQALDWYDNNLHTAYEDLTTEMFDNGRGELGLGSREEFTAEVLSQPEVRQALEPYLTPKRNSSLNGAAFLTPDGELREYEQHDRP